MRFIFKNRLIQQALPYTILIFSCIGTLEAFQDTGSLTSKSIKLKRGKKGHRGKQGHTGDVGAPGPTGATGATGPAGAAGAAGTTSFVRAYGDAHMSAGQTVNTNDLIAFDTAGVTNNVTFTPGTNSFTIITTGVYRVAFIVSSQSQTDIIFPIPSAILNVRINAVNDVTHTARVAAEIDGVIAIAFEKQYSLTAGDVVQVISTGPTFLIPTDGIGSSFVVQKVS